MTIAARRREFFASSAKGTAALLAAEIKDLGAEIIGTERGGVRFAGPLNLAYRVCLWSRLASRVLLPLRSFKAIDAEELYRGVQRIDWAEHVDAGATIAVDAYVFDSTINHSHYAALKTKDAIVDQFRTAVGSRPSVDVARPQLRINVLVRRDRVIVSLDLSGASLHQRGYRVEGGEAPLKETLAAAILSRCGWAQLAERGNTLIDPMCGSGTLLIEAALMAADSAPGLGRGYWGFTGWKGHQTHCWNALMAEARERQEAGIEQLPSILGGDSDEHAVKRARQNVQNAGVGHKIQIHCRPIIEWRAGRHDPGLLVTNPPYGHRLDSSGGLARLYIELGEVCRNWFPGWKAAVFTGSDALGRKLGWRGARTSVLYNGSLRCTLFRCTLHGRALKPPEAGDGASHADMFANRLAKNIRNLGRWARRQGIDCYRLYDADLPEYAVAIDLYRNEKLWVHTQEYQAPSRVDAVQADARLRAVMALLPEALGVSGDRIFLKVRQRQKGANQYGRLANRGQYIEVREGRARLLVNLTDYLDTGLFLDHRLTRTMIGEMAAGKRFLNLFSYTAAATVHAALGGAEATTSVDLSTTYIDWARRNMALNGCTGSNHRFVRTDCLQWLRQAHGCFELIFLDPPTFSNSKSMVNSFDVQRDHVALIKSATRLLAPGGVLLFSNNCRGFKMDIEALGGSNVEDVTRLTIDKDFSRRSYIHNCWRITAVQN